MRLEQAAFLLSRTDQTVTAIAASTGFCDTSHFARVFRQRRGMTPAKVRQGPRGVERRAGPDDDVLIVAHKV
jgi:AraC-like DNA-binding protein